MLSHCVSDDAGAPDGGGDVGTGADVTSTDGPSPQDGGSDGSTVCNPMATFTSLQPLQGFNTSATESTARLSADELTMYFTAFGGSYTDGGDWEIFSVSRTTTTDPFSGAPLPFGLGTTYSAEDPSVSADGLTLYYTHDNNDGLSRLWFAQRAANTQPFANPAEFSAVASPVPTDIDGQPFVSADNAELWFVSSRDNDAGTTDLFVATANNGSFSSPVAATLLNSTSNDWLPTLSFDRLTIYFASTRAGGAGNYDIWTSHRATLTSAFSSPSLVSELNSTSKDFPTWLSEDNCRLYFVSSRAGTEDIYVATRMP